MVTSRARENPNDLKSADMNALRPGDGVESVTRQADSASRVLHSRPRKRRVEIVASGRKAKGHQCRRSRRRDTETAPVHEDRPDVNVVHEGRERRFVLGPYAGCKSVRRVVNELERLGLVLDLSRSKRVSATPFAAEETRRRRTFMIPMTGPKVSSIMTFIE
jgi:hypothetical protein